MTFSMEVEPLVETVPLTRAVVLASLPLLSAGALVSVESLPPPHPARVRARTADAAKMLRADFAFLFMIPFLVSFSVVFVLCFLRCLV